MPFPQAEKACGRAFASRSLNIKPAFQAGFMFKGAPTMALSLTEESNPNRF